MTEEVPGYVLVNGLCYPMEDWIWHLNLAALDYLEARIPEGGDLRAVVRAVRSMKRQVVLIEVQRLTLRRLQDEGVEGMMPQAVRDAGGVIAGVIPVIPLDKPTPPR